VATDDTADGALPAGDAPKPTGNGPGYLGEHYDEGVRLDREDPEFFPDRDNATFGIVKGDKLTSSGRSSRSPAGGITSTLSGTAGRRCGDGGIAFTGESHIATGQLDGLDLAFYGKPDAKQLKLHKKHPDRPLLFGLSPRHTRATNYRKKVQAAQRRAGLR
jgi:hypothetical protein